MRVPVRRTAYGRGTSRPRDVLDRARRRNEDAWVLELGFVYVSRHVLLSHGLPWAVTPWARKPITTMTSPRKGWISLTLGELTIIAGLVTDGLTDRELGESMSISRHTVGFHLRQIFRKLDMTSRRAAGPPLVERRLVGEE
jgi:DNA-binding CsgD family transcriptional regulator